MKTLLIVATSALLLPLSAQAINKCTAADGHVTYTDDACPASSKASGRLVEMPPPLPEDVQRAQDEATRIKDELRRADEQREQARESRMRAEREAALDRDRKELLELERRKVEALETQARAAASAPVELPVVVVRERPAHRPHLPPPPVAQSQANEPRRHDTRLDGPKPPQR
jgi:hypothetical protein